MVRTHNPPVGESGGFWFIRIAADAEGATAPETQGATNPRAR